MHLSDLTDHFEEPVSNQIEVEDLFDKGTDRSDNKSDHRGIFDCPNVPLVKEVSPYLEEIRTSLSSVL